MSDYWRERFASADVARDSGGDLNDMLRAGKLPDITKGTPIASPAEDEPRYELAGRLEKLEADTRHFHLVTGLVLGDHRAPVSMQHLGAIEDALKKYRPVMSVFDPIQNYLGPRVNMNAAEEIHPVLAALADLMERYGVACAVVRHLNKSNMKSLLDSGMGSGAIAGIARSLIAVGKRDPNDADSDRVWAHIDTNLGQAGAWLGFRAEGIVTWTGRSDITADEMLGNRRRDSGPNKRDMARALILDLLQNGPRMSKEVEAASWAMTLAWSTNSRPRDGPPASSPSGSASPGTWPHRPPRTTGLRRSESRHEGKNP